MASDAAGPKGKARPPSPCSLLASENLHKGHAHQPFRHKLEELAQEHDMQVTRLLNLVRDLRKELTRATVGEPSAELQRLRFENLDLKSKLAEADVTIATSTCAGNMPHHQLDTDGSASSDSEVTAPVQEPAMERHGTGAVHGKGGMLEDMGTTEEKYETNNRSSQAVDLVKSFTFSSEAEPVGQSWVESSRFELTVGVLIMLNTVVMMIELQFQGLEAGYETQFPGINPSIEKTAPTTKAVFKTLEHFFVVLFTLELLIRFAVLRLKLFLTPLNWIDIMAVIVGLLEWALATFPVNPIVVRLFRVLKLVRGTRFLKLSKVLESLNMLIKCIRASLSTLFWSLCLIVIIQCIVGMIACQLVQDYIVDLANPEENRHTLYAYFGTFSRAFITMFEIHLANWIVPCRIIMRTLGEIYGWGFVIYRCVVGFSVINVISAVFVQQTMAVAQNDNDIMILQKQRATDRYHSKLKALFKALDEDGDEMLSRTEFDKMATDPSLKAWLGAMDMNPDDLEGLFDLLDTGDGFISIQEFTLGAQRLKGTAKNIDMAHLMVGVSRVEDKVDRICERLANEIAVELEDQPPPPWRMEPEQPPGTISLVMKGIADLVPVDLVPNRTLLENPR